MRHACREEHTVLVISPLRAQVLKEMVVWHCGFRLCQGDKEHHQSRLVRKLYDYTRERDCLYISSALAPLFQSLLFLFQSDIQEHKSIYAKLGMEDSAQAETFTDEKGNSGNSGNSGPLNYLTPVRKGTILRVLTHTLLVRSGSLSPAY